MKFRYDALQDEHHRRRLALLLASPAPALTVLLVVSASLIACNEAPANHAAARMAAMPAASLTVPASSPPGHIVASEGYVDYRDPRRYDGETAVQ